jgi:hypothetical protein
MELKTNFPRPDVNLSRLKGVLPKEVTDALDGIFRTIFKNLDDLLKIVATVVNANAPADWKTFTSPVISSIGTITSATCTGRYSRIGKIVFVSFEVDIITNGTGAGYVIITLPVVPNVVLPTSQGVLYGRDLVTTGSALWAAINSGSGAVIGVYNNTYPGGDGRKLLLQGSYEALT